VYSCNKFRRIRPSHYNLTRDNFRGRCGHFCEGRPPCHPDRYCQGVSPLSEETAKKDETDALDCHYASEALEKLDTLVARAMRLERLPVGTAPNAAVQRYFQEAHDCYLYGFDIACAVLCRAILEAALEDLIAPKDREGKSVVGMVHVAKHRGLLKDERAAWAEEICTAGNLAIHEYQKFEKRYEPKKLEDLFWKARAVVEDLYTK
jgi:hypothetical protein